MVISRGRTMADIRNGAIPPFGHTVYRVGCAALPLPFSVPCVLLVAGLVVIGIGTFSVCRAAFSAAVEPRFFLLSRIGKDGFRCKRLPGMTCGGFGHSAFLVVCR